MPTAVRAQVILKTADGIPANFLSNSWAFQLTTPASQTAAVTTALVAFYNIARAYYGPAVAQNGHEIKYSELPGVKPNYPFDVDTWNFSSAPVGTALPREVAACLSFQGARAAGAPQARRRGRVYLGPLSTNALTGELIATGMLTAVASAANTLRTAIPAIAADCWWGVWSHAESHLVPIVDGWVDNAPDTQRRRGVKASSRTTFS